jgi:cytochrome c peroxidase
MDERFLIGAHPDPTLAVGKLKVTPEVCEIPAGKTTCAARFRWQAGAAACLYAKGATGLTAVSCNAEDDVVLTTISGAGQTYELRYGTGTAPGQFIDARYVVGVPAQTIPAGETKIPIPVIGRRTVSGVPGLAPGAAALTWDGRLIFAPVSFATIDGKARYGWVLRVHRPEAKNGGEPAEVDLNNAANTLSPPWVFDTDSVPPPATTTYDSWGNKAAIGVNGFGLNGRLHLSVTPDPDDPTAQASGNPYRSNLSGAADPGGAYETYKLLVIAKGWYGTDGRDYLYEMRGTIVVANPHSASAAVADSRVDEPATLLTAGGQAIRAMEPSATLDGRLLVFNANPETNDATGYAMYSYNADPGRAPSAWSPPRNVTQLYFDLGPGCCAYPGEPTRSELQDKKFSEVYSVARYALRAPDGRVFDKDEPAPGAYPWITPDGTDLVFSTVPIFSGASRAGTVLAGAHTEGKLVHVDTSLNAMRGNVGDAYNIFNVGSSAPIYAALMSGYNALQMGGSLLGAGSVQKTLFPMVAQYGSTWLPARRNRPMVLASNPFDESIGFYLLQTGRYVEAPLPTPEHDLLVHLPMNELLNFNPVLLGWASTGAMTLGSTRGSAATFDARRTPDLSGNFNTGRLSQAAQFPFERRDARGTAAGCFSGGTCTIVDAVDGAVGNSIHFPNLGAQLTFPLGPKQKYLQIRDRGEFSTSQFFKVVSGTGYIRLVYLPFLVHVALDGNFVRATVAGPTSSGTNEESMVYAPGLRDGNWHHVAVTYAGRQLSVYVDGALLNQKSMAIRPLTNPAADNAATQIGEVGPANSGEFQADELHVYTRALSYAEVKRLAWIRSDPGTDVAALPGLNLPANTYDGLKAQTGEYSLAVAQLGAKLFKDPILSYNGTKSCESCHKPQYAFGDNVAFSAGVDSKLTRRNVPPIVNRVFSRGQLMDGRAESLETQVLHPIFTDGELGHEELEGQPDDLETLITRLNDPASGYPARFQTAFGGPPTLARVSRALAHYVRSIVAQPSAFDMGTLTATQELGWRIFSGKGNCAACHTGQNFTDEKFHDVGLGVSTVKPDDGRFEPTGSPDHLYEFKTPSLRNVSKTAPYFHDGSRATLLAVVNFYNDGGAQRNRRGKSLHVRPLLLSTPEKNALVAFLQSLDSLPTAQAPSGIASAAPVP